MRVELKKRRRQGKTNYSKRINMLKSGKDRILFRKTNMFVIGQYVQSNEAKDKIAVGITSKELMEYGWDKKNVGSLKSISASYLSGILFGKKVQEKISKISAIFDIGLQRNIPGSRAYAFLKGVIDSGVKIECDKSLFPKEERIYSGKIGKDAIEKVKKEIEKKFV